MFPDLKVLRRDESMTNTWIFQVCQMCAFSSRKIKKPFQKAVLKIQVSLGPKHLHFSLEFWGPKEHINIKKANPLEEGRAFGFCSVSRNVGRTMPTLRYVFPVCRLTCRRLLSRRIFLSTFHGWSTYPPPNIPPTLDMQV